MLDPELQALIQEELVPQPGESPEQAQDRVFSDPEIQGLLLVSLLSNNNSPSPEQSPQNSTPQPPLGPDDPEI